MAVRSSLGQSPDMRPRRVVPLVMPDTPDVQPEAVDSAAPSYDTILVQPATLRQSPRLARPRQRGIFARPKLWLHSVTNSKPDPVAAEASVVADPDSAIVAARCWQCSSSRWKTETFLGQAIPVNHSPSYSLSNSEAGRRSKCCSNRSDIVADLYRTGHRGWLTDAQCPLLNTFFQRSSRAFSGLA